MKPVKKIELLDVVNALKEGYTRWQKDDVGFGSIQEKFNLTFTECTYLFSHPDLKGIKTRVPTLEIINNLPKSKAKITSDTTEQEEIEEVKKEEDDIFS